MKINVYHASPVLFESFNMQEQGLHFGPFESAIEAVSRKLDQSGETAFYLYSVLIDTSSFIEEIDHGYDWQNVFKHEPERIKGYVYQNRYEPASRKSYVTWHPSIIEIKNVEKMDIDDFDIDCIF